MGLFKVGQTPDFAAARFSRETNVSPERQTNEHQHFTPHHSRGDYYSAAGDEGGLTYNTTMSRTFGISCGSRLVVRWASMSASLWGVLGACSPPCRAIRSGRASSST